MDKLNKSTEYYERAISIPIYYNLTLQNQLKVIKNIKKIIQ